MMDFLSREKGRLGKIGLAGLMVGGNAGILYMVAELAMAYSGMKMIGVVTIALTTAAAAMMDFKKKIEQEPYVDEDDL